MANHLKIRPVKLNILNLKITQLKGKIIWIIHLRDFGFKMLVLQSAWLVYGNM